MDLTPMAAWLNTMFAGFDQAIFAAFHAAAEAVGFALTPLFSAITFVGENGLCFFVLAFVLMVFRRTRRVGICMFLAICIGAFLTSIVIKDLVARPRPFESSDLFFTWWQFVGAPFEDGFSFPSGHVTAAMSAMTALALATRSGKLALTGAGVVVLMAASRVYLMAHYPTDVLTACLVGALAALASWFVLYRLIGDRFPGERTREAQPAGQHAFNRPPTRK